MNNQTTKCALAIAVVGAVMLGSVPPSRAAPVSSSTMLKNTTLSSGVTEVRYRYHGGAPGAAVGLGILGAAAGAAALGAYGAPYPYRRSYYYPY